MQLSGYLKLSLVIVSIAMITGCIFRHEAMASHHTTALQNVSLPGLDRCQSELSALAHYDLARYQTQHSALNGLLDRSAKYLLTRAQLNRDVQATLDSVYQAELAKRCQNIHSELFRAMLAQADGE